MRFSFFKKIISGLHARATKKKGLRKKRRKAPPVPRSIGKIRTGRVWVYN